MPSSQPNQRIATITTQSAYCHNPNPISVLPQSQPNQYIVIIPTQSVYCHNPNPISILPQSQPNQYIATIPIQSVYGHNPNPISILPQTLTQSVYGHNPNPISVFQQSQPLGNCHTAMIREATLLLTTAPIFTLLIPQDIADRRSDPTPHHSSNIHTAIPSGYCR